MRAKLLAVGVAFLLAGRAAADQPAPRPTPPPEPAGYRLLITGTPRPGGGVLLATVAADSPCRRAVRADAPGTVAALEPGDAVLRVDGKRVGTVPEMTDALQASGGQPVTLLVLSGRTGAVEDWRVTPVGGPPTAGPKLHAVLAGDTADRSIGPGCRADLERMTGFLTGGSQVHKSRVGTVTVVDGERASAAGILKAVAALPSRPGDTVLVYVTSHGAFERDDADPLSGGHFLALRKRGGVDLSRADLRQAVADRPGRLKLLITDACNEQRKMVRPPPVPGDRPPGAGAAPPQAKPKVVSPAERLLFAHAGRLDVNASAATELAVGMDDDGGLFTLALTANMTRSYFWPKVLAAATADAKRAVRGHTQTATVFENSVRPAEPPGGLVPLLDEKSVWELPDWWGKR